MTTLADHLAPGATGMDQVCAMIAHGGRAAIGKTLQFEAIEAGDGTAVFAGTPGEHVYNPIGMVHGGYAAALLDSACGFAVHTKLSATQGYTTLELKVSYHKAITTETGPMRAEGKVLSVGRRAAFAEARLIDATGRLYASATSTLLVFER
jgi:uncharacterized protein (TIGR00369 family)